MCDVVEHQQDVGKEEPGNQASGAASSSDSRHPSKENQELKNTFHEEKPPGRSDTHHESAKFCLFCAHERGYRGMEGMQLKILSAVNWLSWKPEALPLLLSLHPRGLDCVIGPWKSPLGTVSICCSFCGVKYTTPPYLHNKHVYGATISRNGKTWLISKAISM